MSKEEIIGNGGEKINLESGTSKAELSPEKPSVETLGSAALELSTENLKNLQSLLAEELKKRAEAEKQAGALQDKERSEARAKEIFKFCIERMAACVLVLDNQAATADWQLVMDELQDRNLQGFNINLQRFGATASKINIDHLRENAHMTAANRKHDIELAIKRIAQEISGYVPGIVKKGI